jgi:DedD protein
MEPALKTRLLGAAVLIALAIIFVPMFFSGSSQKTPGDQNVSLKIPDQPDTQLQTKTLSVGAESASVASPDQVTTVDADAGKPAPSPQDVAVAPSEPAPAASANQPEKSAAQNPPASTEIAKATPPAAPVASTPGAAANGAYSLNLGIYGERANADKLIAAVKKQGFPAHGESTNYKGKPATRVVVGPFEDRAMAEAERLTLKSLQPKVPVALMASASDQSSDAPANAVPANKAGGWAVQLGAFGNEADANKMRDRLRELGFDGYVDNIPSGKGKLYRVRAGPVNQRARAEELKTQVAAKMKISGIIVTQN